MLSIQTYGTQVTVDSVTLRGSAYLICPSGNENPAAMIRWVSSFQVHISITHQMVVYLVPYKDSKKLPVQVRCTILDAWGWCTGTTQRDGMGREEGGGCRMGNTDIPVADSFRYLAKLIQYCKV